MVHADATTGARMTLYPFDKDVGRALARRQLDIAPACFVVLALLLDADHITPCAGIDTVIRGVARLRQRHGVDAILLVAAGAVAVTDAGAMTGAVTDCASEAELARLRELVRALAMKPHVRFLAPAPVNVLRDCHAAANVLVSTPWRAAAAGIACAALEDTLPVAGSAVGNRCKAVCNDSTGAVIPPRDAETLTTCLARLQRLPGLTQATANTACAYLAGLRALHKPAFQ